MPTYRVKRRTVIEQSFLIIADSEQGAIDIVQTAKPSPDGETHIYDTTVEKVMD